MTLTSSRLLFTLAALMCCGLVFASGATNASAKEGVRLLFVGDIMLDELPGAQIKKGKDPFAAFHKQFAEADIKIGNLECVVGSTGVAEDKPFTFRAHPRVLSVVKKHFSAVSVANNHTGDFGPQAFAAMLDLLDQKGIRYFGGGRDIRAAHQPVMFEVKGKRIAILGYDEFFPRSFEALHDRPGVAWGDDASVLHDIKVAKQEYRADIVIVYPHWGWEHEKIASPEQVHQAHLMIDAGADAVVGGHPHVTQNIETYQGKPIFYSLGNFVFNSFSGIDATTGWALEMVIAEDHSISWKIHVARLDKNGVPRYAGTL